MGADMALENIDTNGPNWTITTGRQELERHVEHTERLLRTLCKVLRGKGDFQPGAFCDLKVIYGCILRDRAKNVDKII